MNADVTYKILATTSKIIGGLITVGFAAVWTIISVGLFIHLFKFAWSAF